MKRVLILALALTATPAAAFDLEKWLDKQTDKFLEEGRREKARELGHKDPQVRLKAVEFFSGNRDPASIDALARVLASDPDARVREAAASGLWRIEKAAEPARPQLLAALDDPDPNVVARAAGALQAMGMKESELVKPRKRVLDSPNASVSARFLVSRNLVGEEPPLRLLVPMLAYLETQARGYTGSISDPQRDNIELARDALEHLVKRTKDRDLIEPLMADLRRGHEGQVIVIKTLGLYTPKPDRWGETLVALLESNRPKVRSESLNQMRYAKEEKDIRIWAPRAAAMLQDPDSSVRSDALWALGAAGGLAANEVDKVVPMLADPKEGVRRNAARALGEMGEQKQAVTAAAKARVATAARPALMTAMESDPDKEVREEAKSALAKIGATTAVAAATPGPGPATPNYASNPGSEAAGLAVLRARNVQFETRMYFKALGDADVELVRAFLDAGMSPKENLFELGPPMRAMLFSSTVCSPKERPTKPAVKEIIKLLLERGADINGADQHGNTALSEAASKGCDRETIRMMVKAGANINATNAAKLTAFEMGLWMGHDGLDELIAAGYRLPKNKVKDYSEGYKDRPASIAMIKKATPK